LVNNESQKLSKQLIFNEKLLTQHRRCSKGKPEGKAFGIASTSTIMFELTGHCIVRMLFFAF